MVIIDTKRQEVKFKAKISYQRYYNDDSNWGVFVFLTEDDIPEYAEYEDIENRKYKQSSLAGKMQQLYIGSEYNIVAALEYNEKYKCYQYTPISISSIIPQTVEQQKQFLRCILTETQADTLLNQYPCIVNEIINKEDNVDVTLLKGIGEITYEKIKEKVINNYVVSDILTLLQPLGVTYNMIKQLLMYEPNPNLLKEQLLINPYIMTRIKGLGFKRVDELALKINPEMRCSEQRVVAFINYYLFNMGNQSGHTWVLENILDSAVRDNINECFEIYRELIGNEKHNEKYLYIEDGRVGLSSYHYLEESTYNILNELNTYEFNFELHPHEAICEVEAEQGFCYTDEQKEIIEKALQSNVAIISGHAGTGKTTISKGLLQTYSNAGCSIRTCAFSAKAAQRIKEATGYESLTIHRLLEYNPMGGFTYNCDNRLPYDVILVDECSMINLEIFNALLSSLKEGSRIIMCGDNGQLPPIGCGNVFNDILRFNNKFSISKLTKVLRQAEKSGIISDGNKIRRGEYPISEPDVKIVNGELSDMFYLFRTNKEALRNGAIKMFIKSVEQDGLDSVMMIVPRRQKCDNSTKEINKIIQDILLPKAVSVQYGDTTYKIGARVIQIENNYEKNVVNGEVGIITDIYNDKLEDSKTDKWKIEVLFTLGDKKKYIEYTKGELSQIDLAYAITCHKYQGSQIDKAIIIIDTSHYMLLDSCWLYTAITRGKKKCALWAEPSAFSQCIRNNKTKVRQTWLSIK